MAAAETWKMLDLVPRAVSLKRVALVAQRISRIAMCATCCEFKPQIQSSI